MNSYALRKINKLKTTPYAGAVALLIVLYFSTLYKKARFIYWNVTKTLYYYQGASFIIL